MTLRQEFLLESVRDVSEKIVIYTKALFLDISAKSEEEIEKQSLELERLSILMSTYLDLVATEVQKYQGVTGVGYRKAYGYKTVKEQIEKERENG